MNNRSSVLLYGPDRKVLAASQKILKMIGHRVAIATNLCEIHEIVTHIDRLDLLVLSHSFSKQQCGRAITLTHARWPGMRSCVLSVDDANFSETVVDEVSAAFRGPIKLGSWLETLVVNESSACSHLY
jgi:hypothetical protein